MATTRRSGLRARPGPWGGAATAAAMTPLCARSWPSCWAWILRIRCAAAAGRRAARAEAEHGGSRGEEVEGSVVSAALGPSAAVEAVLGMRAVAGAPRERVANSNTERETGHAGRAILGPTLHTASGASSAARRGSRTVAIDLLAVVKAAVGRRALGEADPSCPHLRRAMRRSARASRLFGGQARAPRRRLSTGRQFQPMPTRPLCRAPALRGAA